MLLTKELEILQTTSSKCLLEEKNERTKERKKERKEKNRVANMSSQGKKCSSNGFFTSRNSGGSGSCYSRTTTKMCCRLKEREMMACEKERVCERERERENVARE